MRRVKRWRHTGCAVAAAGGQLQGARESCYEGALSGGRV